MPRRKSTVSIPVDPVRLTNPVEKWRKREGLTNETAARKLGYTTTGGYARFVRCEIAPLDKLKKFSEISGVSLESVVEYFQKNLKVA